MSSLQEQQPTDAALEKGPSRTSYDLSDGHGGGWLDGLV